MKKKSKVKLLVIVQMTNKKLVTEATYRTMMLMNKLNHK